MGGVDDQAQPPPPDRDGEPGDGEDDVQADDFETQVHQPGRRPGGEEVHAAAVRALKKPLFTVDSSKRQGLEECQGCGLRKVAAEMECRVCETPTKREMVENIILEGITSIAKEVQVMNELRQGLQRVIVDEVAMSISPEG